MMKFSTLSRSVIVFPFLNRQPIPANRPAVVSRPIGVPFNKAVANAAHQHRNLIAAKPTLDLVVAGHGDTQATGQVHFAHVADFGFTCGDGAGPCALLCGFLGRLLAEGL